MTQKKNTFVVTIRADMRDMALLQALLKDQGIIATNPSRLASVAISLFSDILEAKGYSRPATTTEALQYLQENNIMPMDIRKGRNYRSLIDQLAIEDGTMEAVAQAEPIPTSPAKSIAISPSKDLQATLRRRLQEFKQTQSVLTNIPKELIDD